MPPDAVGNFDQIFFVLRGDDDIFDSHSIRRHRFGAQAADGQHFAAQGNFAGHGDFTVDRFAGKRRNNGGGNRHARAGSVFRGGAFGNVQMDVGVFEPRGVDAVLFGVGFGERQRRLHRFLHHFAELPGQLHVPFAVIQRHFHR